MRPQTAPLNSDLMPSEDADTVSGQDVPEADGAVRRPRGHVIWVWVETSTGDVGQMTCKYPQRLVMIRRPKACWRGKI